MKMNDLYLTSWRCFCCRCYVLENEMGRWSWIREFKDLEGGSRGLFRSIPTIKEFPREIDRSQRELKTDGGSAQIQTDPLQNYKSRAVDEPCEIWRCMLHNPPWIIRRKHLFSAFLLDSLTLEDGTDRMRLQDNVALTVDTRNQTKLHLISMNGRDHIQGAWLNGGIRLKGTSHSNILHKDLNCIHLAQDKI